MVQFLLAGGPIYYLTMNNPLDNSYMTYNVHIYICTVRMYIYKLYKFKKKKKCFLKLINLIILNLFQLKQHNITYYMLTIYFIFSVCMLLLN